MDIGFTGGWLDRADHLRGDPDAMAAARGDSRARLLRLEGGDPGIDDANRLIWSSLDQCAPDAELIFLGLRDGHPYFIEMHGHKVTPQRSAALARMLDVMPPAEAAVFGTARVLVDWHARHGFCARCGAASTPIRGGWARKCGSCNTEHFPRVDPVVIMLAEHDGRALLGRGASWPRGRYSALAGFVEPGESIEEAVAREVFEEAGVRVTDVRYIASQPWPFPGQIMIACIGHATDDTLNIDPNEIEDAIWITRQEARAALAGEPGARFVPPPSYAIAYSLLRTWLDEGA